ncbi:hypothetical protein ACCS78_35485, partial [Rhizobium johnstonii]
GGADIGGADGDGAGQEKESGSREKTLGHDKYPARVENGSTGANPPPGGGTPTASCAGCLTELLRFFVSSVKSSMLKCGASNPSLSDRLARSMEP